MTVPHSPPHRRARWHACGGIRNPSGRLSGRVACAATSTHAEGGISAGYLSGFLEAPITVSDIVSELEACVWDPKEFVAKLHPYPGHYGLAISRRDGDTYLIADRLGSRREPGGGTRQCR